MFLLLFLAFSRYKLLEIELDGIFKTMLLLKKKKYACIKVGAGPGAGVDTCFVYAPAALFHDHWLLCCLLAVAYIRRISSNCLLTCSSW